MTAVNIKTTKLKSNLEIKDIKKKLKKSFKSIFEDKINIFFKF